MRFFLDHWPVIAGGTIWASISGLAAFLFWKDGQRRSAAQTPTPTPTEKELTFPFKYGMGVKRSRVVGQTVLPQNLKRHQLQMPLPHWYENKK